MQFETDFPVDLHALEDQYELIRELGQGGMAAVYLAKRRDSGKLVAIKAIRARYLDDPDALQRFAREARTVADLSHPNIVRTEAIEEMGDRAIAIIMEYVAGGTVRDRLREYGAFSAEDAEAVLRDVANSLRYAHHRGIVHRDVKPENVFLEKSTGRALLSDFGIARRIEGDVPITMLGASLGTPQYMSPEQIDGRAVDGRSDIYSLGVLGWELLTGLPALGGRNPLRRHLQAETRGPAAHNVAAAARTGKPPIRYRARAREGPRPSMAERRRLSRAAALQSPAGGITTPVGCGANGRG